MRSMSTSNIRMFLSFWDFSNAIAVWLSVGKFDRKVIFQITFSVGYERASAASGASSFEFKGKI